MKRTVKWNCVQVKCAENTNTAAVMMVLDLRPPNQAVGVSQPPSAGSHSGEILSDIVAPIHVLLFVPLGQSPSPAPRTLHSFLPSFLNACMHAFILPIIHSSQLKDQVRFGTSHIAALHAAFNACISTCTCMQTLLS